MAAPGGTSVPAVVVAGVHSGVGKTSVALGLLAAWRARGLRVQPFKVGPDFLDPLQHQAACGVASVNLDGWLMGRAGCEAAFARACAESKAEVAVIEGVMGLHDGVDGKSEAGSTAEVAKWLGAPVLLVVDAWCLSRSAAAMVQGYASFDPEVPFCGVLFNKVAGTSHAAWLREAMIHAPPAAQKVPVLGCLPKDLAVELKERHLGLRLPSEEPFHADKLAALASLLESHLDLQGLLRQVGRESCGDQCATRALPVTPPAEAPAQSHLPRIRVAVARDKAFCFYYEDNLRALQAAGAELVFFSPLSDSKLPQDVHALYFGGGYPELHAAALEANEPMRQCVKSFCCSGRLCWAECGGLMYLARRLLPQDAGSPSFSMAGVLPLDVRMTKRLVMGYCHARPSAALRDLLRLPPTYELRSQVFHYSELVHEDGQPAERIDDQGNAQGLRGVALSAYTVRFERPGAVHWAPEGILSYSTVASYCHVHFGAGEGLAGLLVEAARRQLHVTSLHPAATELLCALPSARRRLSAVSALCDYPPAVVRRLPRCTRSLVSTEGKSSEEVEQQVQKLVAQGVTDFHPLDSDLLQKCAPDIVLTQDSCAKCSSTRPAAISALQQAGLQGERSVPCGATTVQEVLEALRHLGAVLGESDEADSVVAGLQGRLNRIEDALQGSQRPRVLGLESVCPLVASGQWLPDLRIRAGGIDALGDHPGAAPSRLEFQDLLNAQADVLLVCCCGRTAQEASQDVRQHLLAHKEASALPSRIFVVGHELLSRPGPRLVDGIEQVAALLHPDRFPAAWAGDALRLCKDDIAWRTEEVCSGGRKEQESVGVFPWHAKCCDDQPLPRVGHSAVACCPDGSDNILVVGGEKEDGKPCADVWCLRTQECLELWDCTAVAGEAVPTPRSGHAAARWGEVLLIFGGWTGSGQPLAQLELLHLQSRCWTHGSTTGECPPARGDATLVLDTEGDRAVLFGGTDGHQCSDGLWVLHLREWRWEPVQLQRGPCARSGHATCAWPGRGMLLHGGARQGGEELEDLWLLQWCGPAAAWSWERLGLQTSGPTARRRQALEMLQDDVLLLTGGQSREDVLSDTWLLPLSTGCWLPGPPLPQKLCRHAMVRRRETVFIWGGREEGKQSRDLLVCREGELLRTVRGAWAPETGASDIATQPIVEVKAVTALKCTSRPDVACTKDVPVWDASEPLSLGKVKEMSIEGDPMATKALQDLNRLAPARRSAATITMLHRLATRTGCDQYVDPASGYSVFTASFLKKRACCGYNCRHCPHGHVNVPKTGVAAAAADW